MIKVVLFQNVIPHYRVPIFQRLGKLVDLTVVCDTDEFEPSPFYKTVKTSKIHVPKVGEWHGLNMLKLIKEADVVIGQMANTSITIDIVKKLFPNKKLIRWGIGVQASYSVRYDEFTDKMLVKYVEESDAALFYSEYPKNKYEQMGISPEKMFVANNTVEVERTADEAEKNIFLFVGSLYKQKRVDILLKEYSVAKNKLSEIYDLYIIGDGSERSSLEELVNSLGLQDNVHFCGQIIDESELAKYFSRAMVCISPDQAGLTVLKSMGYGVPYVTLRNAITGGEIFNIKDKENGLLLDNEDEISEVIEDVMINKPKYYQYGEKAKKYYYENRLPDNMVSGFIQAINYVTGNL